MRNRTAVTASTVLALGFGGLAGAASGPATGAVTRTGEAAVQAVRCDPLTELVYAGETAKQVLGFPLASVRSP